MLENEDGEPLRTSRGPASAPRGKAVKTKVLNENLAPLRRFLEGQVGRPWDKVYSEISEHLKPTSTVQQHVRDHIEDFVAVKTRMRGGKVVIARGYRGQEVPLSESYVKLYVHPRTGLLRKNKDWKSHSAKRKAKAAAWEADFAKRVRELAPDTQLHLLNDGAWWEVKLAKIKMHGPYQEPHTDVVLRPGLSDLDSGRLYGRGDVYAVSKRQLSKADLKKHGLR